MAASVLVVDDDPLIVRLLHAGLSEHGYHVDTASGGPDGLKKLAAKTYHVLLVDLGMPEVDGFAVMRHAIEKGRAGAVLVITGQKSVPVAVEAMRAGATDFITKPFEAETVLTAVAKALGSAADRAKTNDSLRAWRDQYAPDIIGDDPKLLEILSIVQRISDTDCNVLIAGESGTGKELIARAIHRTSKRAPHPFVAVNCAAIPKELMESEMFGHVKGAFTGATERREGRFQVADKGTLFLDEIGEMELSLQAKLLRVIQEREMAPVGESRTRSVDVRILAATNVDLEERCRQRLFRDDLYYRLNVLPIQLPSMASRRADIPLLAHHFIAVANRRHERQVTGINDDAVHALSTYNWPGNVREMANLMERLVILKGKGNLTLAELPMGFRNATPTTNPLDMVMLPENGIDLNAAMERLEVRLTLDALRRSEGNKAKAAELLGLKRTTLIERLKKLQISDTDL